MTEERRTRPLTDWCLRRLEAGLSLRELSRLSGVHHPVISQIESGRMFPTAAEAEAILRVLGEKAA